MGLTSNVFANIVPALISLEFSGYSIVLSRVPKGVKLRMLMGRHVFRILAGCLPISTGCCHFPLFYAVAIGTVGIIHAVCTGRWPHTLQHCAE